MSACHRSNLRHVVIGFVALSLHVAFSIQLVAQARAAPWTDARLGPFVGQVLATRADRGDIEPLAFARHMTVWEDARGELVLPLIIEPHAGRSASQIDVEQIGVLGGFVDEISRDYMRVLVPVDRMRALATHPDIAMIRAPAVARAVGLGEVVSEAAALVGADTFHAAGVDGAGARIAVIDLGFIGLADRIADGELPADTVAVDFTGRGIETGTRHGVAVAEQVADLAPGAELHLINVADEVGLQNAADYCRDHGIDVANHSVAWALASYYDGTGRINEIVNRSRFEDGVMWSVAAGNQASTHWRGGWLDANGDELLDFDGDGPAMVIAPLITNASVGVFMNWNQYDGAVTDLDLFVLRSDSASGWAIVGRSEARQVAGEGHLPIEVASFMAEPDETYVMAVRHTSGALPPGLDITLFAFDVQFGSPVPSSSIMDPASAPGAFTVGAVDRAVYALPNPPAEPFSSRGPTTDGRLKPDIAAPDRTSTATTGPGAAIGTSYAAPVVAGMAALAFSERPGRTADDVERRLRESARDVGVAGADDIFGAGLVYLTGGENTAPTAVDDEAWLAEDAVIAFDLLANDFDVDGDAIELVAVEGAALGTTFPTTFGLMVYRPHPDVHGIDVLTYTIRDALGATARGTATIEIRPVPDPPIAADDQASAIAGISVSIDVLANDTDADGDPVSIRDIESPAYGVAERVIGPAGETIRYTPNVDFAGVETFRYTITDGNGGFDAAAVTVAVEAVPVADCADDRQGPVVTVGRPTATVEASDGPGVLRHSITELCGIEWRDDCAEPGQLIHGLAAIDSDHPNEVIVGPQGAWRSSGVSATWHELFIGRDLDDIGPRTYALTYAVIDRSNNWTLTACQVRVERPVFDGCNGLDDDGDGDVDEDFAPSAVVCGVGACAMPGATMCVGGAVMDACPEPSLPGDEVCDSGADEDCDGETDEDACVPDLGCTPDRVGPAIDIGRRDVEIIGTWGERVGRYTIADLCQIDWRDNCDDADSLLHGLADISTDHATETLRGPVGSRRSDGIATTWHEIFVNENLDEVEARTYSLEYAVLDRGRNWSFVECHISVIEPEPTVCDGDACPPQDQCAPDETGPQVAVATPRVTFELRDRFAANHSRLIDVCGITWSDTCADDGLLGGIVHVRVDDPSGSPEVISGEPGLFRGDGVIADWQDFVLDLDRRQSGPRTYTFTYRVIDRDHNATDVECAIDVVVAVALVSAGILMPLALKKSV